MDGRVWLLALAMALAGCSGNAQPASHAPTPDPRLPYPIPGSCPQTNAAILSTLPERLPALSEQWIGETGIFAGLMSGPAWRSGENEVAWFSRDGQPEVTMRLIEGRKIADAKFRFGAAEPPVYRASVNVPLGGCWEVSASTPNHKLIFLVFAYPERVVK